MLCNKGVDYSLRAVYWGLESTYLMDGPKDKSTMDLNKMLGATRAVVGAASAGLFIF